MKENKNFVFRSLALDKGLNERLKRAAKLDDRSVSAVLRRGMMLEIERIESGGEYVMVTREKAPSESQIMLLGK